jgi:ParB-like chromosome segregation protein Spo0J
MSTAQGGISIPKIERFLRRLEAGEVPPPIKVDNGVIVEGHHRYVAGRLFGKEPAVEIKCHPRIWTIAYLVKYVGGI